MHRWVAAVFFAALGCTPTSSSVGKNDGGRAGGDGSPGGPGPGTSCATGSVTFVIQQAPGGAAQYCLGAPGTCSSEWVSIRPAAGGAPLGVEAPCMTSCADCQPIACTNLCAAPSPLGDGGATSTWDGTYFASATCGANVSCLNQVCAAPGSYVATFCAYPRAANDSGLPSCFEAASDAGACTDVPFVWPPADGGATVVGVIGADGG